MNIDNDELRKADKKAINEICDVFSMDEALAIFDNRLEAHAAAQRQALRDEVMGMLPEKYDESMVHVNTYPSWWEAANATIDQMSTAISTIFEGKEKK